MLQSISLGTRFETLNMVLFSVIRKLVMDIMQKATIMCCYLTGDYRMCSTGQTSAVTMHKSPTMQLRNIRYSTTNDNVQTISILLGKAAVLFITSERFCYKTKYSEYSWCMFHFKWLCFTFRRSGTNSISNKPLKDDISNKHNY
jgi:hypothetical protein